MIFKRDKQIILCLVITTLSLLVINCIKNPIDVNHDAIGTNDNIYPAYSKIVIDTAGTYWGVNGNELYLLDVSKDNVVTIKKTKTFENTYNVNIIQNNNGLTIAISDSAIMYIKRVADSIVIMNYTAWNSDSGYAYVYHLRENQYTVDSMGVFWFLPYYSTSYVTLQRWEGSEITTVTLSDYMDGRNVCISASNEGVVIGLQDTSFRFVKLLHYSMNTITKVDSLSLFSGTFTTENIFVFDTTIKMLVRIHDNLSYSGVNAYSYFIALSEGNGFSFGEEIIAPNVIYDYTSDVVWIENYSSILKITSESETELNFKPDSRNSFGAGTFFTSRNKLFFYNRTSGKVSQLDNLAGYDYM